MTVIEPLHAEILQEAGYVYSRSWTKVSVSTAPPELLAEYTPEKAAQQLWEKASAPSRVWVLKEADAVRGVLAVNLETGEIGPLYIDPDFQGKGFGSALLDFACRILPSGISPSLWVVETNQAARRFYSSRGFRETEETKIVDPAIGLRAILCRPAGEENQIKGKTDMTDFAGIYSFSPRLLELAGQAEEKCREAFRRIEEIQAYNEAKVLKGFADNRVSSAHLVGTTGYGYDDMGRDNLDKVFAQAFGAEDALVRHQLVSGTHTLSTALFGVLRAGDTMVSVTGAPYDTMEEVIGIRGGNTGSLREFGVSYRQVELLPDGTPDYAAIEQEAKTAKMVYIQRSRGYSLRPSLTVETIGKMTAAAKKGNPDVIVFVDNCYGEFVETKEPVEVGADLMAGSLIKNPGGGIAPTGGYIAGRHDLVELCGYRATCPGIGRESGCTQDQNRGLYLGFFHAPSAVANAVKTSCFACALFEELGYPTTPKCNDYRTDIIAAIELGSAENLCAFCRGIQAGSPVDSHVTPEPWAMPGYSDEVIMAAGTFTMGASLELSADGPLREPYSVWVQGGLTYNTGKLGILLAAQAMEDAKQ